MGGVLLLGLSGLAACGPGSGSETPGTLATSPTSASPSEPTAPTIRTPTVTLAGTLSRGDVEGGCLLLTSGSHRYVLVGDTDGLTAGQRVRVTGHVAPDRMTTCQAGTTFQVEHVEGEG